MSDTEYAEYSIEWKYEQLQAENAKLRAEVNDLRATLRNCLIDANFMRAAAAALKETE